MDDLKHKTLKALYWSGIDSFGVYFLKFGFSIAIARILSPEDYGLIGMIAIFIGIARMVSGSGFSMALIQKKEAAQEDFSTIFFFNVFIALLMYILFFFTAGQVASFFNELRLVPVIRTAGLGFVIGSFGTVQLTVLSKKLNFKAQAKINAVSVVISGITGVVLAYAGFNVWALIFQTLLGQLIVTIYYWSLKEWRPSLTFSFKSFKELYRYGYKIFLQGLANTIFENIYLPIIGKKFSTGELGLYTRGRRFFDVFVKQFTIAYGRVMFPAFSSIQDEKERFAHVYRKTSGLLVFFIFPFMMILIVTAEPFVAVVLTEKWLPAVPFMKLFYLEGFFFPLYMLNLNIFNAVGKSEMSLKVEILKKVLLLISIFAAIRYGIQGLIIGQLVSSFVVFIIAGYLVGREINFALTRQLARIAPVGLITLLSFMVCNFIVPQLVENYFLLIILQSFNGILIYFLAFKALKPTVYLDFKKYILPYVPKRIKFIF